MKTKTEMKPTEYKSVQSAVLGILGDEAAVEFGERLRSRKLVKTLTAMRAARGICQSDVASMLDCTQSRVSKIENGVDNDLKVGELEAYAKAVDFDVNLNFTKRNETTFDGIKRQVFSIHRDLCHLADLAHHDEDIAKEVARTFGEVMFNQLNLLQLAARQLPNNPDTDEPYINIEIEIDVDEEEPFIEDDGTDSAATAPPRRITAPVAL